VGVEEGPHILMIDNIDLEKVSVQFHFRFDPKKAKLGSLCSFLSSSRLRITAWKTFQRQLKAMILITLEGQHELKQSKRDIFDSTSIM
jgi:hypothetical protein